MRKSVTITIKDRDEQKTFRIEEMAATQAQRWLIKAALLLAAVSKDKDVDVQNALSGAISGGFSSLAAIDDAKLQPLLDALLCCCYKKIPGGGEIQCEPDMVDGMIEDIKTLFELEQASFKVNFADFFTSMAKPVETNETPSQKESSTIPTLKFPK